MPICSDGGIVHDYHMTLALAMGADFLMLGRYFARFDESPTNKVMINGSLRQGVLGRRLQPRPELAALRPGRRRASWPLRRAWTPTSPTPVPCTTTWRRRLYKVKSTMCNCGAITIPELQQKAKLTLVSSDQHRGGRLPRRDPAHHQRRRSVISFCECPGPPRGGPDISF